MIAALVALGGALGAVLRFVLDGELKRRVATGLPLPTFVINVAGSFVLGWLIASAPGTHWLAFAGTGVCGGFTTFSTASVDAVTQWRTRGAGIALAYAGLTVLGCFIACTAGAALG